MKKKQAVSLKMKNSFAFEFSELKILGFILSCGSFYVVILSCLIMAESYFDFKIMETASFFGPDQPWLPPNSVASPIIGSHYFGDFYLPLKFVSQANPYFPVTSYNNILPLGQIQFIVLSFFDEKIAFAVWLLVSILILFSSFKKILRLDNRLESLNPSIYIVCVFAFCFPLVCAIDRGANVLFVSAIFSRIIYLMVREKVNYKIELEMGLLLAFCLSLKYYLIPFLFVVYILNFRKTFLIASTTFVFGNLMMSFIFGGISTTTKQILYSISVGSGSLSSQSYFSSVNWSNSLSNLLHFLNVQPNTLYLSLLMYLPSTLFILYLYYVKKFRDLDNRIVMVLSLSLFQYLSPISFIYNGVWTLIASILLIQIFLSDSKPKDLRSLKILSVGVFSQMLPLNAIQAIQAAIPLMWLTTLLLFQLGLPDSQAKRNRVLRSMS